MNFYQRVYQIVEQIPAGKVATYGQIAALAGSPKAARQVGWVLHSLKGNQLKQIPWHRVINSRGYISTTCREHSALLQKKLLKQEGVKINKNNSGWKINLNKYLWRP